MAMNYFEFFKTLTNLLCNALITEDKFHFHSQLMLAVNGIILAVNPPQRPAPENMEIDIKEGGDEHDPQNMEMDAPQGENPNPQDPNQDNISDSDSQCSDQTVENIDNFNELDIPDQYI